MATAARRLGGFQQRGWVAWAAGRKPLQRVARWAPWSAAARGFVGLALMGPPVGSAGLLRLRQAARSGLLALKVVARAVAGLLHVMGSHYHVRPGARSAVL